MNKALVLLKPISHQSYSTQKIYNKKVHIFSKTNMNLYFNQQIIEKFETSYYFVLIIKEKKLKLFYCQLLKPEKCLTSAAKKY